MIFIFKRPSITKTSNSSGPVTGTFDLEWDGNVITGN